VSAMVQSPAATLATLARTALVEEPLVWPSFGLVGGDSAGAHADMDYPLLVASAGALEPYFADSVRIGLQPHGRPTQAFEALRAAGILAEGAMLQATRGVNTHKGCVYLMGVLLLGWARAARRGPVGARALFAEAHAAAGPSAAAELRSPYRGFSESYGEWALRRHRYRGIRGIVAGRFAILARGFGWYLRHRHLDRRLVLAQLRSRFFAASEDTCLLKRAGLDETERLRGAARRALAAGGPATAAGRQRLVEIEQAMVARRFSAAAAGDLVAASLLLIGMHEHGCLAAA
jgi:triphosphoribosyl-dephospho-CoA synthase